MSWIIHRDIIRYCYTGLELGRKLKFNRTSYFNLGCREYRKVVIVHCSHEECRSDVGANTGFHRRYYITGKLLHIMSHKKKKNDIISWIIHRDIIRYYYTGLEL